MMKNDDKIDIINKNNLILFIRDELNTMLIDRNFDDNMMNILNEKR